MKLKTRIDLMRVRDKDIKECCKENMKLNFLNDIQVQYLIKYFTHGREFNENFTPVVEAMLSGKTIEEIEYRNSILDNEKDSKISKNKFEKYSGFPWMLDAILCYEGDVKAVADLVRECHQFGILEDDNHIWGSSTNEPQEERIIALGEYLNAVKSYFIDSNKIDDRHKPITVDYFIQLGYTFDSLKMFSYQKVEDFKTRINNKCDELTNKGVIGSSTFKAIDQCGAELNFACVVTKDYAEEIFIDDHGEQGVRLKPCANVYITCQNSSYKTVPIEYGFDGHFAMLSQNKMFEESDLNVFDFDSKTYTNSEGDIPKKMICDNLNIDTNLEKISMTKTNDDMYGREF